MSMFDRIKGRFKKEEDTSASSEESFDLDDDALFGSGDSLGDDALGTVADDGGDDDAGLDTFGTMGDEEGDLGAAGTADFEGFDDLGDSLGGESFGDEFGNAAVDEALDAPEDKKGKKKKKAKAAKRKPARRPGGGKVLGITIGAGVGALVVGLVAGTVLQKVTSGEGKLRAEIEAKKTEFQKIKGQLAPLTRAASAEEVAAMQAEMTTRSEYAQAIVDIDAKVADLADQQTARDTLLRRRDAAAASLAVRTASLANIVKEAQQLGTRVAYLQTEDVRLAERTLAHDAHVRRVQTALPASYTATATADATRTLSVHMTAPR